MQQQVAQANEYASAFEAFITLHPMVSAILIAIVCSWTLTAAIKPWVPPNHSRARLLRTVDCLIAFTVSALMLHKLFPWHFLIGLCLLIGSGSPFVYWALSEALCWKWPGLRRFLSLRELAPEQPAPSDNPVPPGDTQ